jgi:hypothetical protein
MEIEMVSRDTGEDDHAFGGQVAAGYQTSAEQSGTNQVTSP